MAASVAIIPIIDEDTDDINDHRHDSNIYDYDNRGNI